MRSWNLAAVAFGTLVMISAAVAVQDKQPVVVQPGAPGAASKTLPASTKANKPVIAQADVEFIQGMIMHHQQAVEMTALIPSRSRDEALLNLGKRISLSQADEIKWMRRWLESRGKPVNMEMAGMGNMPGMQHSHSTMPLMPGMLSPEQMNALRNGSGSEFDRLFLKGMIQHHGGALLMVKELFETPGTGQDGELFDFATDVDNTQRAEINLMEKLLKEIK
jgi:uncharacterized protein (DUF305 family)